MYITTLRCRRVGGLSAALAITEGIRGGSRTHRLISCGWRTHCDSTDDSRIVLRALLRMPLLALRRAGSAVWRPDEKRPSARCGCALAQLVKSPLRVRVVEPEGEFLARMQQLIKLARTGLGRSASCRIRCARGAAIARRSLSERRRKRFSDGREWDGGGHPPARGERIPIAAALGIAQVWNFRGVAGHDRALAMAASGEGRWVPIGSWWMPASMSSNNLGPPRVADLNGKCRRGHESARSGDSERDHHIATALEWVSP